MYPIDITQKMTHVDSWTKSTNDGLVEFQLCGSSWWRFETNGRKPFFLKAFFELTFCPLFCRDMAIPGGYLTAKSLGTCQGYPQAIEAWKFIKKNPTQTHPWKVTWHWKIHYFSIGNRSSNGGFSVVIWVFGGGGGKFRFFLKPVKLLFKMTWLWDDIIRLPGNTLPNSPKSFEWNLITNWLITLPETNVAPENLPSQTKTRIPYSSHPFSGAMFVLGSVKSKFHRLEKNQNIGIRTDSSRARDSIATHALCWAKTCPLINTMSQREVKLWRIIPD